MTMQWMTSTLGQKNFFKDLAKESILSGTIASIAMIPFGILFQLLGLRVGHYGKKLLEVFFTDLSELGLPCRISVYTEKGKTKIGLIKPVQMLSALSQDAALLQVAKEVEEKTIQMVDEAK